MKRIFIALFTIMCTIPAFAQNTDYIEMAKEVDQEVWGDKDPVFDNTKLPGQYKNESAVILARKQTVETNTERKGRSLLYVGKMHSTIKRTIRERIFINDQVSLDAYSEINFNQLQSKQSGAITKLRTYTFMGIRVTKADGSLQKINVEEASVKLDETKDGKKNKIAVPNLAIGDIIDYYITYFDQARTDKDVDYLTFILGDEYPILNLGIKVLLDKRVAAQYQTINGAPDFKITSVEDDNLLELKATDLSKSTNVMWVSQGRQVPIVRIKYAFADIMHGKGDYTKHGTIEKVTSPEDVEHQFMNLIKPFLVQTQGAPIVKSAWKTYAKEHDIDKDNLDSIIPFVYHYFRYLSFGTLTGISASNANYEDFYDSRVSQNTIKQLQAILNVMKTINAHFDADAELVLVSDKTDVAYKDVFSIADLNFMIRVPGPKGKFSFYYFGSSLFNFDEMPPSFEDETYRFIQQNTIFRGGRDMSQEKADMINGKATTLKTSAITNNQSEDIVISFDSTNMQLLHISRKTRASGHQRRAMQTATLILEDYLVAERKVLDKETDIELEWRKLDKYYKKYWVDAQFSITKAREEQKKKFEKEIANEYVDEPKELKKYTILQKGFTGSNASIAFEEEFSMDGWVKKAGNNYIIEAGKFAGGQLEIKADQRERKLDIYMPYARSFNHNIVLKIPEGYTIEGAEKLNKSVKNECGGFESTAKVEGNNLVITYYKYYNNLVEPASNWSKIMAFVDAGFAFTKEKLLLKKK
ncbi:MAG: hypothetical protein ABIN74_12190 [Ferruginibacter sp.]